jgi:lysophospholipase L1-like esterase
VLAGLVASLVIAELVLRAAGFSFEPYPHLYPRGVARGAAVGTFVPDPDLLWTSSSYEPAVRAARTSRPALVLLGDSCTAWGDYDERLAAMVAVRGASLSFSNLAVGGWSTFQGLRALRRDILGLEPRVVVMYFGWNDHWTRFGIEDAGAARLWSFPRWRLVQLVQKLWIALHSDRHDPPPRVQPAGFRENLREMVQLARNRGAVPVLVTAASSHRPGEEPSFLREENYLKELDDLIPLHQQYVSIVRQVAEAEGVILCDPERRFPAAGAARDELFRPDGIHLSDAGNQALAALLLETLSSHDLLKTVSQ